MVKGRGWIGAASLMRGDELITAEGKEIPVSAVQNTVRTALTYNFEVANFHTYFVGSSHIWAHSANCLKVLQTGGNKIENRTARELRIGRRDLGRALEELKANHSLGNDHHTKIWSNGDYTDASGNYIYNILDYIP